MGLVCTEMTLTTRLLQFEAGLGWITKFTKSLRTRKLEKTRRGVTRKLVAFEMQERAVPRHDYEIVDGTGAVIGIVTSGPMSVNERN
jgi:aminomethyltransferase